MILHSSALIQNSILKEASPSISEVDMPLLPCAVQASLTEKHSMLFLPLE